jgi:hypothetical protein
MNSPFPTTGADPGLTPAQRETLRALLNIIVPPSADGRMPGAGELAALVRDVAGAGAAVAQLRELLARLDRDAIAQCGVAFGALDEASRVSLLDELRTRDPAPLQQLALATVTGYYQQDRVLEGLGMEARPPFPKGYQVEPGDLSMLDPVIARGRIYRDLS